MTISKVAKALTAGLLALSLAACVDVGVDVALTSPTTADATLTQTMTAEFYAIGGTSADQPSAADLFCQEQGVLLENADGSATCTILESGAFGDLDLGQDEGGITFTPLEDGLVRIAMSTAELQQEAAANGPLDAQTEQMANAFFTGRMFTVRFSGAEVTDTNMTLAEDSMSASQTIPLLDIIKGEIDLPDEYFAVVRAP